MLLKRSTIFTFRIQPKWIFKQRLRQIVMQSTKCNIRCKIRTIIRDFYLKFIWQLYQSYLQYIKKHYIYIYLYIYIYFDTFIRMILPGLHIMTWSICDILIETKLISESEDINKFCSADNNFIGFMLLNFIYPMKHDSIILLAGIPIWIIFTMLYNI